MKFSHTVALAFAAESVNAAALQPRHYTFPSISGSGQWSSVRQTLNFQSNAGVTDVSSDTIRCYTSSGRRAPQTQSVAAGSSVAWSASPNIFHPGPLQFYMAKVPAGQTAATWEGTGDVWFKIYAEPAITSNGQLSWASLSKCCTSHPSSMDTDSVQTRAPSASPFPGTCRPATTCSASSTLRCMALATPTARSFISRARRLRLRVEGVGRRRHWWRFLVLTRLRIRASRLTFTR